MNLSHEPVRAFTDREIAMVLGAIVSSLMMATPPTVIRRALAFMLEHFDTLAESVHLIRQGSTAPEIAKRIVESVRQNEVKP